MGKSLLEDYRQGLRNMTEASSGPLAATVGLVWAPSKGKMAIVPYGFKGSKSTYTASKSKNFDAPEELNRSQLPSSLPCRSPAGTVKQRADIVSLSHRASLTTLVLACVTSLARTTALLVSRVNDLLFRRAVPEPDLKPWVQAQT